MIIDGVGDNNQENGLGEPAVKCKFREFNLYLCPKRVFKKS